MIKPLQALFRISFNHITPPPYMIFVAFSIEIDKIINVNNHVIEREKNKVTFNINKSET